MNTRKYSDWVDYAKGIGIVLVVFGHVADGAFRAGVPFDAAAFTHLYRVIYSFHMPLFFFLAGLFFLQSLQHRGASGLIASKIDTIVYPYILWSLIQGSIQIAFSRYTNVRVSVSDVLALLWHPLQEFWYLYALFFVFVLACISYSIAPRRARAAILIASITVYVAKDSLPHAVPINYLAGYGVFFFAGVCCAGITARDIRIDTARLLLFVLIFAIIQTAFELTRPARLNYPFTALALGVALISIACVIAVSVWATHRRVRWLRVLGRQSLAIYVMHTLFASGVRIVLQKVLHVESLAAYLLLGTAAGIVFPVGIAQFLERKKIPGVFSAPPGWRLSNEAEVAK